AVEDITAKDDYTVVISLKEPWGPFLADISLFSNSIMPEKVFKGAKDEDFANKPVGSGPFMLVDWKKGEEQVMKANPHYYEKGFPKSQELRIKYIGLAFMTISSPFFQSASMKGPDRKTTR